MLTGHWKQGIAWYCGLYVVVSLGYLGLSLPITLSFIAIVAIELSFVTLSVIYFIALFISSYRPTRRLTCRGWFLLVLLAWSFNLLVSESIHVQIKAYIARHFLITEATMYPTLISPWGKITVSEWASLEPSEKAPSHWADRVNVSIWSYLFNSPHRGDIVFIYQNDFVWDLRIVGLPGETVDICTPYVLINGEKLLDPPIFAKISSCADGYSGYIAAKDLGENGIALPLTLGPDEYFMLGDNPYEGLDSRYGGPISREAIVGQVTRIIFPPWRIQDLTTFDSSNKNDALESLDKSVQNE